MQEIRKHLNNEDVQLESVCLNHDDDGYSLNIVYLVEDETCVERYTLSRVRLPINNYSFTIKAEDYGFRRNPKVDVGFGFRELLPDADGFCYIVDLIENKPKEMTLEMTLEEIEKKLGHKVKIISKEEAK